MSLYVCSPQCQTVIDTIAQKLGNEDAALYRVTHAAQPDPPLTAPRAPPALSDTVVEHEPSQPLQHSATNGQSSAKPGLQRPAQPVKATGEPTADVGLQLNQENGAVRSNLHLVSHPPKKGSKAGPLYAAGSSKVPIMLAAIQVSAAWKVSCLCSA